jgi:PAS domain S-box-containing protein
MRLFFAGCAWVGIVVIGTLVGWTAYNNQNHINSQLSERQDLIYSAIESDSYPLCVMRSDGRVTLWNSAMEELTGISKKDALNSGFESMMCDPVKRKSHHDGVVEAFKGRAKEGSVTIVNCSLTNVKTHQEIPVRIAVRIVSAGPDGKLFAMARIDRDSQIREFGTPSAERSQPH